MPHIWQGLQAKACITATSKTKKQAKNSEEFIMRFWIILSIQIIGGVGEHIK